MDKNYFFNTFEDKWYDFWYSIKPKYNKEGLNEKTFTILQPPPNVTGNLHLGHALNNTYQDILVRYNRVMNKKHCIWIPGLDHGGISTQFMVNRYIKRKKIKIKNNSHKFNIIEKWTLEKKDTIIGQLKKMGCLCNWEKLRYTMDEQHKKTVEDAFLKLYNDGKIYKGKYMVNWCTKCYTALSDIELVHKEDKNALLYNIKYRLWDTSSPTYITISTTRPETIFGDVAIAYNKEDERYNKKLKDKYAIIPIINKKIPIIESTDKNFIKMEFGTGLVKITPAHDKNDFNFGKKHLLKPVNIIGKNGKMTNIGKYNGLNIKNCRNKIISELEKLGCIVSKKYICNNKAHCYKCHTIIEPILSEQWFLSMESFKKDALQLINDNHIKLFPKYQIKKYNNWINNINDWCLSRSIIWGHKIPIWNCTNENCNFHNINTNKCIKCNNKCIQETDVLDTWFSSALWSYATNNNKSFDILITGSDILFFWVARMIMMNNEIKKTIPFRHIFLHGIIRDEKGIKMSKTLKNVIDPLYIIDTYGADALRFTLIYITPHGKDVKIKISDFKKIGKTFCTKLWNAIRYITLNVNINEINNINISSSSLLSEEDKNIILEMEKIEKEVHSCIENFEFTKMSHVLYDFVWNNFCNKYIQYIKNIKSKTTLNQKIILLSISKKILKLLHPIIPFITEELWSKINNNDGTTIINGKNKK
jgi:valyl-tRNA synthetase